MTGALEAGGLLAAAGIDAEVTLRTDQWSATATVVDTETRHAQPRAAAELIRALASSARQAGVRYLFKKTDSTLRGPIAAELTAVIEAWPGAPLAYLPAYPRLGRTVRHGRLHVHGVESGDIRALLAGAPEGITVFDAESEEDLSAAVAGMASRGQLTLTAGPAGAIRHLVDHLPVPRRQPQEAPCAGRGLVVCGSLHPRSQRQMASAGLPVVPLRGAGNECAAELAAVFRESAWGMLNTSPEAGASASARLAAVAGAIVAAAAIDTLVVFGGDTAAAVFRHWRVETVRPVGEVLPGIPAAKFAGGITLVTKAGGFGHDGIIRELLGKLHG